MAVVLFGVIVLIIVIAVGAAFLRQSQVQPQPAGPSRSRNLFDLQIGDVIQHLDIDWIVEGCLTYNEGGYTWLEYQLQDGDRIAWLSVEEDDRLEVALSEPINDLEVGSTPTPPSELSYQSQTYRCTDSGTATMTRTGTIQKHNAEQCQYFDYTGPEGRVLAIENWDGDIEITAGHQLHPRDLTILPGDGRGVNQY